jgi:phage terminase large subunit-like protein
VRRDINALGDQFAIKEIAADRLFQGEQLVQQLGEQDGFEILAFGQGFKDMAAPTKAFERVLLERKLRHGGNPVLRWQASNVTVKIDEAGNMKPDKKKSSERIDGIVAAIMALGRAMLVTDTTSVYETSDLFVID